MANTVTVVAEMLAKPGKEEQLRKQVLALVEPSRKDPGCIQYDLHQGSDDPRRFVFYENWTSRELLEAHLKTPHLEAFGRVEGELLAEPARITLYTRIA